mmetsp:Transcript_33674/g.72842  ORF Transcript_33674/g.72842 Transcript_33674/m.72842 type:complete len:317 (-) Transcript_33674:76-1026(-)
MMNDEWASPRSLAASLWIPRMNKNSSGRGASIKLFSFSLSLCLSFASSQGLLDLRGDLGGRSVGLDVGDLVRVVLDDGSSLGVESRQAGLDGLGVVILSLDQGLAREVVQSRRLGRRELLVVGPAAARVDPATRHTLNQELIGDLEAEDLVDLDASGGEHLVELLRLRDGSWEAVEDEAGAALGLLDGVADDADDEVVRDERARLHGGLGLHAERGLRRHGRAEHVARRQVAQAVVLLDRGGLRSLAASRGADKDEPLLGLGLAVESPLDLLHEVFGGNLRQVRHTDPLVIERRVERKKRMRHLSSTRSRGRSVGR